MNQEITYAWNALCLAAANVVKESEELNLKRYDKAEKRLEKLIRLERVKVFEKAKRELDLKLGDVTMYPSVFSE